MMWASALVLASAATAWAPPRVLRRTMAPLRASTVEKPAEEFTIVGADGKKMSLSLEEKVRGGVLAPGSSRAVPAPRGHGAPPPRAGADLHRRHPELLLLGARGRRPSRADSFFSALFSCVYDEPLFFTSALYKDGFKVGNNPPAYGLNSGVRVDGDTSPDEVLRRRGDIDRRSSFVSLLSCARVGIGRTVRPQRIDLPSQFPLELDLFLSCNDFP